jgi:hypothetical protein
MQLLQLDFDQPVFVAGDLSDVRWTDSEGNDWQIASVDTAENTATIQFFPIPSTPDAAPNSIHVPAFTFDGTDTGFGNDEYVDFPLVSVA